MVMRPTGWRRLGAGIAVAIWAWSGPAMAQQQIAPRSAILTLDQDALFARTKFGKALFAAAEQEAAALKAENRGIDAALEAEERSLTARRAAMPMAEFRVLADAFDKKVESLRAAQDAKSNTFSAKRDTAQQQFFQAAAPIIGDYMVAQGASAIVSKAAIVVSLGSIDITDEVITQIDDRLGAGVLSPLIPGLVPQNGGTPATP